MARPGLLQRSADRGHRPGSPPVAAAVRCAKPVAAAAPDSPQDRPVSAHPNRVVLPQRSIHHRGITALGVYALQRPCGSVSRSVIWRAMIVGHAAHSTTAITRGYPRSCVAFAN
jgi:hypothetical protein